MGFDDGVGLGHFTGYQEARFEDEETMDFLGAIVKENGDGEKLLRLRGKLG